jgi:formylglycine-generating enzyme required for sulfatase activity
MGSARAHRGVAPRGDELAAAKAWLASQPKYAPDPTLLHHEFIKAGEDAESAHTSTERQRLDAMTVALEREKAALRKGQRVLAAATGLFACIIIVGAFGWYEQNFLREQYYWRVVMRPSLLTATQENELAAKPGSDFKECANGCPTMIVVPAGKFTMGSPEIEKDRLEDEGPQHEVTITKPFAVSKFAVTFAEWDVCVAAGACRKVADSWGRNHRPAINVSWEYAQHYAAWLSRMTGKPYRLLSEAEWEYAARAGSTTAYPWGDEVGKGNANCIDCGSQWDRQTAPVGSFKPNAFGLYDMHGNVWQWVEDTYENYEYAPLDGSARFNPSRTGFQVVRRGGSWFSRSRDLRSAARGWDNSVVAGEDHGFRLARTLAP